MILLRPNSDRAKYARNFLLLSVGLSSLYLVQSIYEFVEFSTYSETQSAYMYILDKKDPLSFLHKITSIVGLITAVRFIQWFRRAYFNLHLLRSDLRFSESTAAWSWFVPVFSLYAPFIIMRELVSKSKEQIQSNGAEPSENIQMDYISAWWFTFWGTNFAAIFGSIYMLYNGGYPALRASLLIVIFGQIMNVTSGLVLAQIISKYAKIELQLAEGRTEIDLIGVE
jgi:hypothetical protein